MVRRPRVFGTGTLKAVEDSRISAAADMGATPTADVDAGAEGVSVIICCYNSAARLPKTLAHLARQIVPSSIPWEIIVVNNASTDETASVAGRVWREAGSSARMRIVDEPNAGLSRARERGVAVARFETIVFVDDDNWLEPDYCNHARERLKNQPLIGGLGGFIEPHFEGPTPSWFASLQSLYAVGPQAPFSGDITDIKPHLAGAGLVLRKSAYDRLRASGFTFLLTGRCGSQLVSGEDTELCYALALSGYRIWYDEDLRLVHFMPHARLTRDYVLTLADRIEASSQVAMLYEVAFRDRRASIWRIYVKGVKRHLLWTAKSLAKLMLRRNSLVVFQVECNGLWHSFTCLPTLVRLFRKHYPGILRLKERALA